MELAEELATLCVAVKAAAWQGFGAYSKPAPVVPPMVSGRPQQVASQVNAQVENNRQNAQQQGSPTSTIGKPATQQGAVKPIQHANIGQPAARLVGKPLFGQAVKQAAEQDLKGLRERFEDLERRERVLRTHAKRWQELSEERAAREEPENLTTFMERLAPVPHTALEAAVRAPVTLAGGLGGYMLGRHVEPGDIEDIQKALTAVRASKEKVRPIQRNLADIIGAAKARGLVGTMRKETPETVSEALRGVELPEKLVGAPPSKGKGVAALRQKIDRAMGRVGGRERLKSELASVAAQMNKGELPYKFRPWRWGGALGGLALGGALSGLPFALNAIMQKGRGGEAAVRAAERSREIVEQAEELARQREALL